MKFLLRYYIALLAVFVAGRLRFACGQRPDELQLGLGDYFDIAINGLYLDVPMAGYLIIVPLLWTIILNAKRQTLNAKRFLLPYNIIIGVMIAAAFEADNLLYPFWKFKLDASVLTYLDSPQNAVASVSAWFVVWHTLLAVAIAAFLSFLFHKLTPKKLTVSKKRKALWFIGIVILCGPLAISIRGGVGESTANIGKVYYSQSEFCNHAAVNPLFSFLYSLGKTDDFASLYDFYEEQERAERFAEWLPLEGGETETVLRTDRPNVLLIILEGFGGQFIEAISGRKDITPEFNRLAREGLLFTNCYSSSFRTDRGVLSTLSGYPAFPVISVMKMPVKSRTLPCLARSLNAEGYTSSFLYGGDINFTNMQSYLRTGGYSDIVSDKDFSLAERKDNPWGVNDHITFARLRRMIEQKPQDKPWHIAYLTLSSHEPWTVPYARLDEEKPNAFAYTDHCLGEFMRWFRQTEAWKNTLIVLIPDHGYAYPDNITHEKRNHNAMLWLGGALKRNGKVTEIMSQCDLAATLLAQLGIEREGYLFSRNVFATDYKVRQSAYFTYNSSMGYVDTTGHTVYDLNGNMVMENHDTAKTPHQKDRLATAKALIQTFHDDLGAR